MEPDTRAPTAARTTPPDELGRRPQLAEDETVRPVDELFPDRFGRTPAERGADDQQLQQVLAELANKELLSPPVGNLESIRDALDGSSDDERDLYPWLFPEDAG